MNSEITRKAMQCSSTAIHLGLPGPVPMCSRLAVHMSMAHH